jgi:uncharacterized protein (DUF885 family)
MTMTLSCAHAPASTSTSPPPDDFSRLVDAYFDAKFTFEPTNGTSVGLHQYDRAFEDLSAATVEARAAEVRGFVARLEKLAPERLAAGEALDRAFLISQARAELFDLETRESWRHNPMGYAHLPGESIDALIKRAFAPEADRLRSVVARLKAIPRFYEVAKTNLDNPAPEHTALAIRMAKGSIAFFEKSAPKWAATTGADSALMAAFTAANGAALAATRAFADWLERDLRPRSKGAFALGEEKYRTMLRHQEMVETPLPELLAMGEAQLEKDRAAFVATAAAIAPGQSPTQVAAAFVSEHPKAADLLTSVARDLEAARRFATEKKLVTFPAETRPRVIETPSYARAAIFAAMDTPGPFEAPGLDAFYWVTPVEPDWTPEHVEEHLRMFNRYTTAIINVHEAYPGHFLQFLYMPRIQSKVRKLLYATSNVEGWAHYTEQMMVDEGFGDGNPRVRLAQLQEALLRDCRFVAAIKLHTQGMTVEQATTLFIERGLQEPANAREEAMRGTYDPMYLAYTLGKLQILALRERYLARPGHGLRDFHDAFVAQGGLPVAFVEKLILTAP